MTTTLNLDEQFAVRQPELAPSYDRGAAEPPLLAETIGDNLDRTAAAHGDRDALVEYATGRRFTYAQLRAEVDALAHGLLRSGIAKGDRVGIWAPNCAEWMQLQYATAKIGAILVCINPAYRTHELQYVLVQAGVRLLVAARSFKTSDYAAMIAEVAPDCPGLEQVVLIGSAEWDALYDRAGDPAALAAHQAALDPHDAINIQYTSGTTGNPKGATLSHHNILNNAHVIGEVCRYTEPDRICVPVPLFHIFGMVIGNLGATTRGRVPGLPGAVVRRRGHAGRGRGRALHVALRGAGHVHRRARRARRERAGDVRPELAAHRHDGGLAVPGRGDEAGRRPDGHDRGDDRLRDDRDLADLHPDPARRLAGAPGVDGGPRPPARRDQDRRPGDRGRRCPAACPGSSAPAATR